MLTSLSHIPLSAGVVLVPLEPTLALNVATSLCSCSQTTVVMSLESVNENSTSFILFYSFSWFGPRISSRLCMDRTSLLEIPNTSDRLPGPNFHGGPNSTIQVKATVKYEVRVSFFGEHCGALLADALPLFPSTDHSVFQFSRQWGVLPTQQQSPLHMEIRNQRDTPVLVESNAIRIQEMNSQANVQLQTTGTTNTFTFLITPLRMSILSYYMVNSADPRYLDPSSVPQRIKGSMLALPIYLPPILATGLLLLVLFGIMRLVVHWRRKFEARVIERVLSDYSGDVL